MEATLVVVPAFWVGRPKGAKTF